MSPINDSVSDSVDFPRHLQDTSNVLEQSVLGCLLADPEDRAVIPDLAPTDFSDRAHGDILRAIDATPGGDIITVFDKLREWGRDQNCGGLAYLNALVQSVPARSALPKNADLLKTRAQQRRESRGRYQAVEMLQDGAPIDEVRELLSKLSEVKAAPPAQRYKLLSVSELHDMPQVSWRIHSILPAAGTAALFGPSTAGKSFLALDMVAAGCIGGQWFGHKVKPGRWVYVALEGQAAFRQRVRAWEIHHDAEFPDAARFMFTSFRLTERDDVLALAAAIDAAGGADVIVIDTLNRAAPDADENSSVDMGRILDGVQALQTMTGGTVLLVHHAGKDATKGMRGHSSLFAALDAAISVTREGDRREWSVGKSKDGQDGERHPFSLELLTLGEDEDGEPITSCAVEPLQALDDEPLRVRLPKGGNQKIVYDALGPLFRDAKDKGQAGAPFGRPCLQIDAAVAAVRDRLTCESKRRTERTQQAITGLVASQVLASNEGWIWLR